MKTIGYGIGGRIPFVVLSYDELVSLGWVLNPNMYLGDGFMHCAQCNQYRYHFAMTHSGNGKCIELCKDCNSYVAPVAIASLKGLVNETGEANSL